MGAAPASFPLPMRLRLAAAAVLAACLGLTAPGAVLAVDSSADLARKGLAECEDGRRATDHDARQAHFTKGKELGDQAVALDDKNPDAHFAVFCNMGELMRIDGESISSVLSLRSLMAELDRTLALDPNHCNALAAKGTLLIRLPRLLGGDPVRGESMLRDVLVKDPNAVESRLTLAKTVVKRGERDEALAFATRALQIARAQGRADKVAEAQATLDELHAAR
jgi:hypothetical protein